jgi:hypothetical protein
VARNEWYTDNANRRYPFDISDAAGAGTAVNTLPTSAIVDAGFTCLHGTEFNPGADRIWVEDAVLTSTHVQLTLVSSAAGIAPGPNQVGGFPLVFDVPRTIPPNTAVFASCEVTGSGLCSNYLLWHGFVVIGDIAALVDWLTNVRDGELHPAVHVFEPHCVQSLQDAYMRSITVANRRRTRTTDVPGAPRAVMPIATCRQGPQRFVPGYNCVISYDTVNNGLLFSARLGEGEGQHCGEVPQFPEEPPVAGSSLLSGGPTCRETIRSINGVLGPAIRIRGENGVTLQRHATEPGRLVLRLDPTTLAR